MLKQIILAASLSAISCISCAQSFFGSGNNTTNSIYPSVPTTNNNQTMSADQYRANVSKLSQQKDEAISQRVKQMMPPPPQTQAGSSQTAPINAAGPTPMSPSSPTMPPSPPPQTSVINQPANYPSAISPVPGVNPSVSSTPSSSSSGGQVYTGFGNQSPPRNTPTSTINTQQNNSGWSVKY